MTFAGDRVSALVNRIGFWVGQIVDVKSGTESEQFFVDHSNSNRKSYKIHVMYEWALNVILLLVSYPYPLKKYIIISHTVNLTIHDQTVWATNASKLFI